MKLAEIIETFISGDWGNESITKEASNAVYCIRGADFMPITKNEFNDIPQRFISDKSVENKILRVGDLIIEKSGGSPTQSTGRIIYISDELVKSKKYIVCSNFCIAIRVKPTWNPLFIYYYWQNIYNNGVFFNFEGKTSGIKNIQLENALESIDIDSISLEKQNEIVAILSSLDNKIAINRSINHNLRLQLDHSLKVAEVRHAA